MIQSPLTLFRLCPPPYEMATVEFDSLLLLHCRQSQTCSLCSNLSKAGDFHPKNVAECQTSIRHLVDFVEFNKLDRVEYAFVTSVYRAFPVVTT